MNKNHKFITEGIFENGSRCDVLDLTDGVVYEILNSEDEKNLRKKLVRYPEKLDIVVVEV